MDNVKWEWQINVETTGLQVYKVRRTELGSIGE